MLLAQIGFWAPSGSAQPRSPFRMPCDPHPERAQRRHISIVLRSGDLNAGKYLRHHLAQRLLGKPDFVREIHVPLMGGKQPVHVGHIDYDEPSRLQSVVDSLHQGQDIVFRDMLQHGLQENRIELPAALLEVKTRVLTGNRRARDQGSGGLQVVLREIHGKQMLKTLEGQRVKQVAPVAADFQHAGRRSIQWVEDGQVVEPRIDLEPPDLLLFVLVQEINLSPAVGAE